MFLIKLCMFLTFVSFFFHCILLLVFQLDLFTAFVAVTEGSMAVSLYSLYLEAIKIFSFLSSSLTNIRLLLTISRAKIIILDNVEYSDTTIRDIFHDVDPSNCLRTQKISTYPNIYLYGCTLGAVDFSRFKKQRFGMISI